MGDIKPVAIATGSSPTFPHVVVKSLSAFFDELAETEG